MDDMNKKDWVDKFRRSARGRIAETPENYDLILENDPVLKDLIYYDELGSCLAISRRPPWSDSKSATYPRSFKDKDYSGYTFYLMRVYDLATRSSKMAHDSLKKYARKRSLNPVKQYLDGLEPWDGIPRVETLFVDYLGAEDTDYTRAVTKCILVAAVARTYEPGKEFSKMLVLQGPQGIGKSTIIRKLAKEKWFCDGLFYFNKESWWYILGGWLIEVSSLDDISKAALTRCTKFISQNEDTFRKPYEHDYETHLRRCVFFGTMNESEFLYPDTDNGGYWIVPVGCSKVTKRVWNDLDGEVDQIWAEAVKLYRDGTKVYLPADMEQKAQQIQDDYVVKDSRR